MDKRLKTALSNTRRISNNNRSSRPQVFCQKGFVKNFLKYTGKHLCRSLFFNENTCVWDIQLYYKTDSGTGFFYEFWEIFKNTFFIEHLQRLLLQWYNLIIYILDKFIKGWAIYTSLMNFFKLRSAKSKKFALVIHCCFGTYLSIRLKPLTHFSLMFQFYTP